MQTLDTSRLDEKGRVIIPKAIREELGLIPADKAKGERGSMVVFKKDDKGRIYIEKI